MDIIKTTDERYREYEKVLLERDNYRCLAEQYLRAYIREFGQLMTDVFEKKISCIEKKKTIAFCQMCANRGEPVDLNALSDYISKEMAEYRKQLEAMIADNNACKGKGTISESERMQIKQIYRNIAKRFHPDIFPSTAENDKLRELWNRVVSAYNRNDLKEISELEILVSKAIENEGGNYDNIDIPDIEDRIAEIEKEINDIISTDPYRYKYLLEDDALVAEKKAELQREIDEYTKYEKELQDILKTFLKNGATFQWEN